MEAILNKVIPISYDEENEVLYFDAMMKFNSKNFKYLKSVTPAEKNVRKYASHSINFKNIKEGRKGINILATNYETSDDLEKLIIDIHKKVINKKLQYGMPLILQTKKGYSTKVIQQRVLTIYRLNLNIKKYPTISSNTSVTNGIKPNLVFVKVGNGCFIVDEANKIIFDIGGQHSSKPGYLLTGTHKEYDLFVSHNHDDHFKYYSDYMGHIKSVNISRYFPLGKTAVRYFGTFSWVEGGITTFKGWKIWIPKIETYAKVDQNFVSMIFWHEDSRVLLTSDSTYKNIDQAIKDLGIDTKTPFENYLVPHHGSIYGGNRTYKKSLSSVKTNEFSVCWDRKTSKPKMAKIRSVALPKLTEH